jgi:hypothetical protein
VDWINVAQTRNPAVGYREQGNETSGTTKCGNSLRSSRLLAAQDGLRSKDLVITKSSLGGPMVSVLATGSKGRGFKPGRRDGFLMTIKILITPSFGWEVKPKARCS